MGGPGSNIYFRRVSRPPLPNPPESPLLEERPPLIAGGMSPALEKILDPEVKSPATETWDYPFEISIRLLYGKTMVSVPCWICAASPLPAGRVDLSVSLRDISTLVLL
jgi:hypothetical protein